MNKLLRLLKKLGSLLFTNSAEFKYYVPVFNFIFEEKLNR